MYYSDSGEALKKFNTRDGMGIEMLSQKNIDTILITRENSKIVKQRAKKLKIKKSYYGVNKKELLLDKICSLYAIKPYQIAYIGDDVNDVEIMKLVGFSGTPMDGTKSVKKIANYICKSKGGEGAFREFAEVILEKKI